MTAVPLLLSLVWPSASEFPSVAPYRIPSNQSAPVVDGELDEGIWQSAPRIREFHQIRPEDHGQPSEDTEVLLAYDSRYFYVGLKAYDSEPEAVTARGLIQGQTFFSDDRFEVRFDTFNDRRNAYFFQVNANGIRREALVGNDYWIEEWDTVWFAQGRQQPWGWSAEMAIPFNSLSFDPDTDTWGLNLSRVIPRKGEEVSWSSLERRLSPAVSGYALGLSGLEQGLGIEIEPSVSIQYEDLDAGGGDASLEPSLTGFYRFNPFLTGALTLNTDFSATEADSRQVNLTRFSLFFPEKRDFFLQDASIFEFADLGVNGRPFFSRRIGLSGTGEPLDLEFGAKVTGRAGNWNVGALAVRQDPGAPGASSELFVGRASRNVGDESTVGAIATYGDPLSDRSNALVGADFNYRNSRFRGGNILEANTWYQRSDTEGIDSDQEAFGAMLAYPNDRIDGFVDYRRIERNFNPALGFVNRTGVSQVDSQIRYRHRRSQGYWQWLGTRVQFFRSDRIGGGLQSESYFFNVLEGFSSGNDFFTFFTGQETEDLQEPFEIFPGLVIPAGRYSFDRHGVFAEFGAQRVISGSIEVVDGDFFGGTNLTIAPSIRWRPNRHFLGGLDYVENRIELPQGDFTSRLFRVRADVAINAHWAWLSLVQGDNLSDTVSLNSRLRWEPRPDRRYFLVFNQLMDRDGLDVRDTEIVLQASFNLRY